MQVKERDIMGGLAKGLKVIEAFTAEHPRLSISEAADISGYDRATTRRCLLTLAELGYCAYDGKYFTVTPRVLRLGTGCLASMPLPRIVQPWLDRLSEEIGQSTSVSILDDAEIVYVARASQRRVMSIALMPGSRLPAYCTSMGRVLLAALPSERALELLSAGQLAQRTPKTQTDVAELQRILQDVKAAGYAFIDQEVEIGLRSIAVPLVGARGQTLAALNVGLAATEEPMHAMVSRYLPALLRIKAELSGILV
ncbi:IclR family transcriptional regulator C-terminal domain-containing protein [Rhizobium sp. S163]|uniref:IclR family transcriptional regulator domain-containing protein n=1 Tax=Rhizobium sp. S163 TaxID=3055039 RepID=UPI000DDCF500|nr:IclR family transcriptional regulator C-terminal domain-containing protein [Rhizobium sp. S163]MDM9645725.1 IclR family transcriptional regulator C-terminal domain-containing protein [Rhizobium sp. S163]